MAYVNANYQKLAGAYLFREVDHRVTEFCDQNPSKKRVATGKKRMMANEKI